MTIHADFFKIVKEGCSHAFTDAPPVRPDVVFIDGQVKLMKADAICSWDQFFSVQFYKTIEKCFGLGAHTVVLGFDNYDHVPASKAMTQAKRAKQRVNYDFAQTSSLPSRPPEDWGAAMANRTFKVKVVSRVLEVTKTWFEAKLKHDPRYSCCALVLDYRGVPSVLHGGSARGSSVQQFVDAREWLHQETSIGRGECDIKAFSWLQLARCLCIVSVDGDYLPLALLQRLNAESRATPQETQDAVDGAPHEDRQPSDVLLYRMVTRAQAESVGKRKSSQAEPERVAARTARQYEFVHITPVSMWLRAIFPSKVADPVQQFCAMIALCGCDFARNLPRLGPRSLWKMRKRVQNVDLTQPTQALCALSLLYHDLFVNRNTVPTMVTNSVVWFQNASDEQALASYEELATQISKDQRISPRIREQMWPTKTSHAHALNVGWTMQYWTLLENAPDPHSADFGYVRDSKGRTSFAGDRVRI
jgi:hypothetical protein